MAATPPESTASEASTSIQQPSWATPSGVTLWPAARSPCTTVRAERIETWCSTLLPPNITPTCAILISYRSFSGAGGCKIQARAQQEAPKARRRKAWGFNPR
jgi:hypothetical protein